MGVSLHRKMLTALRFSRAATRTMSARTFRSTPAVFEKLPEQPDAFPAGELINEITGANGLRREEIEAQALGLNRFEGEWSGPAGTKENPTVVESVFNHRIVGIPRDDGHGGDAGEAKWFHLHAGEAIEMDGQWFVLKQVSDNVLPEFERSH